MREWRECPACAVTWLNDPHCWVCGRPGNRFSFCSACEAERNAERKNGIDVPHKRSCPASVLVIPRPNVDTLAPYMLQTVAA